MAVVLEKTWQGTKHFRPLDGLRGIAVSMVFWCHYGQDSNLTWWGWTGVDLFFVLSGLLITGILFDAPRVTGYFSKFYKRRSLRIFPLYFSFWAVVLLAKLFMKVHWPYLDLAWPLYVGNFLPVAAILRGLKPDVYSSLWLTTVSSAVAQPTITLGHFWSLCVEEQFYFVWPVVVWFCRSRRALMRFCIAGVSAILLLRVALHFLLPTAALGTDLIYKLTFTRADSLLMGAWLALYLRREDAMPIRHAVATYCTGAGAFLLLLASILYFHTTATEHFTPTWLSTYGLSLPGVVGIAVLVAAMRVHPFQKILMWKPLLRLGRVSYGFYVFHAVIFSLFPYAVSTGRYPPITTGLLYFGATWGLSELSFRLLEEPFLRLKTRWAPALEEPVKFSNTASVAVSSTPAVITKIAA